MSLDFQIHRPIIRLLVRLMGVFFVIDGGAGIISNGLTAFWEWRLILKAGQDFYFSVYTGYAIGSLALFLAGLYLVFRGTMAMDAIFHEALEEPSVPCPDCGYDLRGNEHAKTCPECGVDLNRPATPSDQPSVSSTTAEQEHPHA